MKFKDRKHCRPITRLTVAIGLALLPYARLSAKAMVGQLHSQLHSKLHSQGGPCCGNPLAICSATSSSLSTISTICTNYIKLPNPRFGPQTLGSPCSAVSTPILASKYPFFLHSSRWTTIFVDFCTAFFHLGFQTFAPLQTPQRLSLQIIFV